MAVTLVALACGDWTKSWTCDSYSIVDMWGCPDSTLKVTLSYSTATLNIPAIANTQLRRCEIIIVSFKNSYHSLLVLLLTSPLGSSLDVLQC